MLTKSNDINFLELDQEQKTSTFQPLELQTNNFEIVNELKASSLFYNGKPQYITFSFEDFEKSVEGWSFSKVSECVPGNKMLGGHCLLSTTEVKKTYNKLPVHTQLRISGTVSFIDDWQGESLFISLDGNVVASQSYKWCEKFDPGFCKDNNISVCGTDIPDKLNVHFELSGYKLNSSSFEGHFPIIL